MRKIIAIQVNTNPTRWVESTFPRVGNMVGVVTTDQKELAHDFLTEEKAADICKRIHNPFDRVYKVKSMTVAQPSAIGN